MLYDSKISHCAPELDLSAKFQPSRTHAHPYLHMYLDKYTRVCMLVCVCVFALVPDNYVQFTLHNTRAHENARFRFKLPWLQAACGRETPVGRQQATIVHRKHNDKNFPRALFGLEN